MLAIGLLLSNTQFPFRSYTQHLQRKFLHVFTRLPDTHMLIYDRTFGNSTYTGGMAGVVTSFGISKTIATIPISCYSAGLGIGALFSTAFSEVFGRRIVYRVTAPLALIFTLLGGCATNFATIAIARALAGLFASPCLTVGGGIISDVWNISLEKTGTTFAALFVLFVVGGTRKYNLSFDFSLPRFQSLNLCLISYMAFIPNSSM